jgi:WD40-like Beta Propeller Repeat
MKAIQTCQLISFVLILMQVSCNAQSSSPFAPEAGIYKGGTTTVSANYQYGYNGIRGFGMQPSSHFNYMPSPMGDLSISSTGTNKGNYYFTKMKNLSGAWQYNPSTEQLIFTGFLKESATTAYYPRKGMYTLDIDVKTTDKGNAHYQYYKKASKPFPKITNPNGSITGSFTLMPDFKTVTFFDAAKASLGQSFNGKMAATNKLHQTITVGFTDDPHNYQITIWGASGILKKWEPDNISSLNWKFIDYKMGVLSNDGKRMALLGKTVDSYADLTYTPGYYAIGIFDVQTGAKLGLLPIQYNKFIKPCFLSDGRIVYVAKDGGIAISSADYRSSTVIYSNPVNAITVSPDGKMIAFSEGIYFYTMNIDGSDKKQIICNGKPAYVNKAENVSDMCWSPDGKYAGLCTSNGSKFIIVAIPLDGSDYKIIKDENGDEIAQANPLLSWH